MPDDLVGDIAEGLADAGSAIAGELKKFGQAAVGQISGSSSKTSSQLQNQKIGDDKDESEVKKFAHSFASQIFGSSNNGNVDVGKMAKADSSFSKREADIISAKIKQIYQEHAVRKAREKQQIEAVQKKQEEEIKLEQEEVKKQKLQQPNSAVAKTRAEIKNYGAE